MSRETTRARRMLLIAAVVLIAAGALLWSHTPLASFADEDRWAAWIERVRGSPWATAAVIGFYVVAGLVEFPIVVLIGATAAVFEPLPAIGLAFAGSMASAVVFYVVGARFAAGIVRRALGAREARLRAALGRRGIVTIVLIRSIPIAPFTVVNLAAGSIGVRFRDYLIGTALGLAPGILLLSAFGEELRDLWARPDATNIAQLALLVAAWIGVIGALQAFSRRREAQRASEEDGAAQ